MDRAVNSKTSGDSFSGTLFVADVGDQHSNFIFIYFRFKQLYRSHTVPLVQLFNHECLLLTGYFLLSFLSSRMSWRSQYFIMTHYVSEIFQLWFFMVQDYRLFLSVYLTYTILLFSAISTALYQHLNSKTTCYRFDFGLPL